jgi:hypothetical protein
MVHILYIIQSNLSFKGRYISQIIVYKGQLPFNEYACMYSQTCIKRSTLGQGKSGLIRQVTS